MHAALRGDGKLEQYDVSLHEDGSLRALATLGNKVCGHPEIVHGGAIAALLDDSMGILFLHSKLGSGFTAKLDVNYRVPIPAGTPLVVECAIVSVEPAKSNPSTTKVVIKATVRGLGEGGMLYTEATALFVAKSAFSMMPALWISTKRALGMA